MRDDERVEEPNPELVENETEETTEHEGPANDDVQSSESESEPENTSDTDKESGDEFDSLSAEELKELARKQQEEIKEKGGKIASDRKRLAALKRQINKPSVYLDPQEQQFAAAIDNAETTEERIAYQQQLSQYQNTKNLAAEMDNIGRASYQDWDNVIATAVQINPNLANFLLNTADPEKAYQIARQVASPILNDIQETTKKPKVIHKKIANKPIKEIVDSPTVSRKLSQSEKIARMRKIKGF